MTLPARFPLFLLSLLITAAGGIISLRAQEAPPAPATSVPPVVPATSSPGMQRQFSGLYASWKDAMEKEDFEAWQKVTAQSRQARIRNRIVSQRLKYPESLFQVPVSAPPLRGLLHVDTLVRGDTASSVYFGKADFGISAPTEVRDNFIVLRFVREFGLWKYDNLRIVKFGDDPELLLKIRNGDNSFLQAPEFLPDETPPAIPGPVGLPDYIAEVWITAVGYEVEVVINTQHSSEIANNQGRDLIIGGLSKGNNRLSVEVKEIPIDASTPRHLEIGIYGVKRAEDEAQRFYHYRSTPEAPVESYQTTFAVPTS